MPPALRSNGDRKTPVHDSPGTINRARKTFVNAALTREDLLLKPPRLRAGHAGQGMRWRLTLTDQVA